MVWEIKFSLDNIKKSCLSIPKLSKHKWNKVSGGKFGVMFVSENGRLIVKLQRVMEIKGLEKEGFKDGFYPVPVNINELPKKNIRKPSLGAYSEVIYEAELTKKMGEMNICPKVISYGFCPDKSFFYMLMKKKGLNFFKLCDQYKKLGKERLEKDNPQILHKKIDKV